MIIRAIVRLFLRPFWMAATPSITPSIGGSGSGGGGSEGSGSGSGGNSNSGAPPASTGAPGGSPTPTSGGGTPSGQGTPGQGQGSIDWATAPAHFRTAYETQQAELARWTALGDHSVASMYVNNTQKMVGEAYQTGRGLGYSDQDIQDALRTDLVKTLTFLRTAQAKQGDQNGRGQGQGQGQGNGQGRGQIDPALKRELDQRLSPVEQHLDNQMVDAANQAFMTEYDRLFDDAYKEDAKTMPKEVKEFFKDAVSEMFKYDVDGLKALKFQRDTKAIAKTFTQVKNRFDQALNAYHMWQLGKAGGGASGRSGQGGAPNAGAGGADSGWAGLSLDDIAQGDDRAVKLIPSMR